MGAPEVRRDGLTRGLPLIFSTLATMRKTTKSAPLSV